MKTVNIKNNTNSLGTPSNISLDSSSLQASIPVFSSISVDYAQIQFDSVLLSSLCNLVASKKAVVRVDGVEQTVDQILNWSYAGAEPIYTNSLIYVSTQGDDNSGTGTVNNPFKTITKAYSLIPEKVNQSYTIKIANGTYTDFPALVNNTLEASGQIVFDGYEGPIGDDEVFEVTSADLVNGSGSVGVILTLADADFDADTLYGKYLKVTSDGDIDGALLPIFSNTATTVTTLAWAYSMIASGDEVEVVDVGVEIETDYPIVFGCSGVNTLRSQAGTFNLSFNYTGTVSDDSSFLCNGTTSWSFLCTNLINASLYSAVEVQGSGINAYDFLDPDACSGTVGFGAYEFFKYACTVQRVKNTVPTVADYSVFVTLGGKGVGGTQVSNICTRDQYISYGLRTAIFNSMVGSVDIDHGSYAEVNGVYACSPYFDQAIRIDDFSSAEIGYVDLDGTFKTGVLLQSGSTAIFEGDVAGEDPTEYTLKLEALCRVQLEKDQTASGTINDVYFTRNTTAAAYPAAGSALTDSQGSFVLR